MRCIADVIAGAMFDFMGYLTSRKDVVRVGSTENCQPLMDAFKAWCAEREFDYGNSDPNTWQLDMMGGSESPTSPMSQFEADLSALVNHHSMENGSDTPDFILAGFLVASLCAFNSASNRRTEWYRPIGPPSDGNTPTPLVTPGV